MKFDAHSSSAYLLPRQGYGIDFYGIQGGEILVIVDLFTREAMFEYLPNRGQELVAQALLNRIVFSRGVPLYLRSDNAPELMQGVAKQICEYLNIQQIVTGGHNPRGNAICERVNQSLGSYIRKMSDDDYKKLRKFLPALEFATNSTVNSATGLTPFEVGHGLPPHTVMNARKAAASSVRGTDPDALDALEDVDSNFDKSVSKDVLEMAEIMATEARSVSEWHKRMTREKLNQSGQKIDLEALTLGLEVYFYKPPTVQQVERRNRKAKHIDHYVGPAVIKRIIGKRSFVMEMADEKGKVRQYQRDAGMIIPLRKPQLSDPDPTARKSVNKGPSPHNKGDESPRVGEYLVVKDMVDSPDWYVAQVSKVVEGKMTVNYHTTADAPLDNYKEALPIDRWSNLRSVSFLRTWVVPPKFEPVTVEPQPRHGSAEKWIWNGKIPSKTFPQQILIRNVGLDSKGKFDDRTLKLAMSLNIPHHHGAGGEDDFNDKEAYRRRQKEKEKKNKKKNKQK